jgi:hypothetical protein
VNLWLHGHKHHWYVLPMGDNLPFAAICAGSGTQTRRWGYHEYVIDGWHLTGLRRVYDPQAQAFVDADTFELRLQPSSHRQCSN